MRLNRGLILSLLGGVAAVSSVFAIYQSATEMHAMKAEVDRQMLLLADSQRKPVIQMLQNGSRADLQALTDQFRGHASVAGMAIYNAQGQPLAITSGMAPGLAVTPPAVAGALQSGQSRREFLQTAGTTLQIFAVPLQAEGRPVGAIVILHDGSFIGSSVWRHALASLAQTLLIAGICVLIVHWTLAKPLRHMAQWLHDLRTGSASAAGKPPQEGIFHPLTSEVTRLATSLHAARAAADQEARLREAASSQWTPDRLRVSILSKLKGSRLFAVSNREPYEHRRQGSSVTWSVPASGLVTALEPVLRASDGTWIAQASGDADKETVDERGRLRVPPDHPQYTLRRVWLSKEEEQGFYFGFANEGLWPLCHIAHTRPVFRGEDWEHYGAVNRKFAAALLDEMSGEKEPLVLVQDYHFALLPRMIKERRPNVRVAIFWHIPWPNPEAFGICPWQRELLDGMLGADLIGFHIQAHCNNFLATVDRTLESRIDWEHFAVNRRDHITTVRPFPISVTTDEEAADPASPDRAALLRDLGGRPDFIALGVDRIDYTKGIPERLRGIERLLELYPSFMERFTFIQIGAPSRTRIRRYQDLAAEVEEEAERINRRFGTGAWKPIVLLKRHHSRAEVLGYYRAADLCLVTSLHDGMNLVAKEYVAARHDEQGALILSRFAGASHELSEAFVVNPYDTDELAHAIYKALTMPAAEMRTRMQRMRAVVKENNVYRWAGNLIGELADIRLEAGRNLKETPVLPAARRGPVAADWRRSGT